MCLNYFQRLSALVCEYGINVVLVTFHKVGIGCPNLERAYNPLVKYETYSVIF